MSRLSYLFALLALLVGVVSAQTKCGGEGYDVSSAAQSDLSLAVTGSTNYTYFVHPCGVVTNPACQQAGSSFCQANLAGNYSFSLATYPANAPQNITWVAIPGQGVQQIVQDGAFCGAINAYRETTLFFQCNSAATTAYLSSVKEVETCHYTAVIQTAAACTSTALTGQQQVGETRVSNVCGGGVYDLSSIANQDITYNTNTSSATAGYVYVFRPCGNVANGNCSAVGPSMLCQSYKTGGAYLLATFNASVQTTWTVTSNGLAMSLQDGTYCGAIGANREATINFICDTSATTPVFTSLNEVETCWYTATIRTSAVCNRIDMASSGTTVQPGAGSSGGNSPVTPGNNNGASMTSSSAALVVVAFAFIASLLL